MIIKITANQWVSLRHHFQNLPEDMLRTVIDKWSCSWFHRNEFFWPDSIVFTIDPIFCFIIECVINWTFREYVMFQKVCSHSLWCISQKLLISNPTSRINKCMYWRILLLIFECIPCRIRVLGFVVDVESIIACIININVNWALQRVFKYILGVS